MSPFQPHQITTSLTGTESNGEIVIFNMNIMCFYELQSSGESRTLSKLSPTLKYQPAKYRLSGVCVFVSHCAV